MEEKEKLKKLKKNLKDTTIQLIIKKFINKKKKNF